MRLGCVVLAAGLALLPLRAHAAARALHYDGRYLELGMAPEDGGAVRHFALKTTVGDLADGGGLLQEGLFIESYCTLSQKLDETLEMPNARGPDPLIRYTYDCIGRWTNPLHVTRLMEPLPDAASMRITWTIKNDGDTPQWVAPWVRNHVSAGGALTAEDRLDVPTPEGVIRANGNAYFMAARNWIAVSDAMEKETLYAVFHADQTYAFLTLWEEKAARRGFQTAFTPRLLAPGEQWQTVYWVNAVRGLGHVDFATVELAVQVDYRSGELAVQMAAVRAMPGLELHAAVVAPDGRQLDLPTERIRLDAAETTRCLYPWAAPGAGAYVFRARLTRDDQPVPLGRETGAPHGDIEAPFFVGEAPPVVFRPWTRATRTLDHGPRTVSRRLAAAGTTAVWFETALEKVFPGDTPEPVGTIEPTCRIALARNERESFQLVLRPPAEQDLKNVRIRCRDLVHKGRGARIPASDIEVYHVTYHPIRIPSYFEGETGLYPDALPPFRPFDAVGGCTTSIWFTVYARPDLPAATYSGLLELAASGMDPVELWIEARVYDFTLPETPAMKTDFRFAIKGAATYARALGGSGDLSALAHAYLENALAHRVTLRELVQLPAESADYAATLRAYEPQLQELLSEGLSTIAAPASLLDVPVQLEMANAFVGRQRITDRAFVPLSHMPETVAWPRLRETMQRWKAHAPDIPIMVLTSGFDAPAEPEGLDVWTVPMPILDSPAGREVRARISAGKEIWGYVDETCPRRYANFFTDAAAIEPRILFWQAWALGIRGMHYWAVNHAQPGQDPWKSALDNTPVNGNGMLLYPGPEGPVNSIRWECIRDGIEDCDYLAILRARCRELAGSGADTTRLRRIEEAGELTALLPEPASFPRDAERLLAKRAAIAEMIEELGGTR